MSMTIGQHRVGPGEPVFVIAELGVNHDGSVERALSLVEAAARAGADAVKLQCFDPDHLLSAEARLADYQQNAATDVMAMLRALQLDIEAMHRVAALVRALGLGFIVTPFSLEDVQTMRELEVDAVQLASPDCVNRPLIRTMSKLGRPMLISVGATTRPERDELPQLFDLGPIGLLQCVSAYPVPTGCSGLGAIAELPAPPSQVVGYSDHTTEPIIGGLAVACGAQVIEKHLTYDRAAAGPDHAASFDPAQFAEYVGYIRIAQRECVAVTDDLMACQTQVRQLSRQSLCATRDLPAGHIIKPTDLTIKRPGTGVPAAQRDAIVGRTLARDCPANHLIRPEHLVDMPS